MVVAMGNVAPVVLQVVDGDDAPGRVEVRNEPISEGFLPIQNEQRHREPKDHARLNAVLEEPFAMLALHRTDVCCVVLHDGDRDAWRKLYHVENVHSVTRLGGAHDVALRLRVLVVTEVVSGDESAHRWAVSE